MNNKDVMNIVEKTFSTLNANNFDALGKPELPMYEKPLFGILSGDDEYFDFLKEHIGEFHWTPQELFELKYSEKVISKKLKVIVLVFPQTEQTRMVQRETTDFPADEWLISRGEWEPLMTEFSQNLLRALGEIGIRATSTDLQQEEFLNHTGKQGMASRWSQRHIAYGAGLGTFGLGASFISEKGAAVRIATCVMEIEGMEDEIKATGAADTRLNPFEWCLFYKNGTCGACIKRCPAQAITEKGKDKEKCRDYEDCLEANRWPDHLENKGYMFGCGICQCKIPCESGNPTKTI